MRVVVFCGPTLSTERALRELTGGAAQNDTELDCDPRAPAARGDVLAAALSRPHAIALIDGYFDRVPSVWHKELLWAMSQGIHVFGAASMGALRAAELAAFGMQGVGKIFASYRDGALTDDDEVTVAHASEALAFKCLSDALVNVRATLDAAQRADVISADEHGQLLRSAKALPYWERSFSRLLRDVACKVPLRTRDSLAVWLERNRVDQKFADACELLGILRQERARLVEPFRPTFSFAATDAWHAFYAEVASREPERAHVEQRDGGQSWFDELLVSEHWEATHAGALWRARVRASGSVHPVHPRAVEAVVDDFRRERGLTNPASFREWIEREQMTEHEVVPFFEAEAEVRRARLTLSGSLERELMAQLRADGRFGDICARALHKRTLLEQRGLANPLPDDAGVDDDALWRWYFEKRGGMSVPAALDAYAERLGVDVDRLRRAVLREYCYARVLDDL